MDIVAEYHLRTRRTEAKRAYGNRNPRYREVFGPKIGIPVKQTGNEQKLDCYREILLNLGEYREVDVQIPGDQHYSIYDQKVCGLGLQVSFQMKLIFYV